MLREYNQYCIRQPVNIQISFDLMRKILELFVFPLNHARGRIRTGELLRERTLNPSPLTWLGNPRAGRQGTSLYDLLFSMLTSAADGE